MKLNVLILILVVFSMIFLNANESGIENIEEMNKKTTKQ